MLGIVLTHLSPKGERKEHYDQPANNTERDECQSTHPPHSSITFPISPGSYCSSVLASLSCASGKRCP
jgi:hypothetical protein